MRYVRDVKPEWKGKPKASPLDVEPKFQSMIVDITKGTVPKNGLLLIIDQVADGKKWGVKNAWRLVRDQLKRKMEELGVDDKYVATCRQTVNENEWGLWVMRREEMED